MELIRITLHAISIVIKLLVGHTCDKRICNACRLEELYPLAYDIWCEGPIQTRIL